MKLKSTPIKLMEVMRILRASVCFKIDEANKNIVTYKQTKYSKATNN